MLDLLNKSYLQNALSSRSKQVNRLSSLDTVISDVNLLYCHNMVTNNMALRPIEFSIRIGYFHDEGGSRSRNKCILFSSLWYVLFFFTTLASSTGVKY